MKKKGLHKKTDPFKVQENYFKDFEHTLFERIQAEDAIPKKEGFKVPNGYFNTFEARVFHNIKNQEKETKVVPLSTHKKWLYGISTIAATLAIFLAIKGFLNNNTANSIASTEVQTYIENGYFEVSAYDLADIFEEESFADISMEDGIDNAILIDYLLENTNDYQSINNEE